MTIEVDAETKRLIEAMRKPVTPELKEIPKTKLVRVALDVINKTWLGSMGYAGESYNDVVTRIRIAYQAYEKE